jgi:predicted RNA-binding Zn-ribbon protein involved in translation (DUF1610 family)
MSTFRLPPGARVTGGGRVCAPHYVIREFDHRCRHCGWEGPGTELSTGEVHESSGIVDFDCPQCSAWIAFSFPTPESDARARKEYEAFLGSVPR